MFVLFMLKNQVSGPAHKLKNTVAKPMSVEKNGQNFENSARNSFLHFFLQRLEILSSTEEMHC